MNLLKFLYWLQKKEFHLWLENNSLKFKQLQPLKNKNLIFSLLKANKDEICKILRKNEIDSSTINYPYIYKTEKNTSPLSFAQERLFFIDQFEQGTNAYNIPCLLKLNKNTNVNMFTERIKVIINKHKILRTVYTENNEKYLQKIIDRQLNANKYSINTKKEFDNIIKKAINHIFDLEKELPIKVDILNFSDETFVSIVIHHIAFDGWSFEIFFKELEKLESETAKNKIICQYKDFAEWQRYYFTDDILKKQQNYWNKHLRGYENLDLPTDKARPSEIDYKGSDYYFTVDKNISNNLRELAKENNTTLYCILLSAFYILLHKYTHQSNLIIGTPIANRHYNQSENIIGFFVNSLPLKIELAENNEIKSLISQTSILLSNTQKHQDIPFEKIINDLNIEKDLSRNPIFQVMFSLEKKITKKKNNLYSVSTIDNFNSIAKFDLNFTALNDENTLDININYATSLYNRTTIKRMAVHYTRILTAFINNLSMRIKDIKILSEKEFQTIVYDWNKTKVPYPKDKTIQQLFEKQVEKTPDNIAVVFEKCKLTYRELNNRTNQLAHTIRERYKEHWNQNITSDTLIGIYIERSIEMTIAILGILKAGGAYVPFDNNDPKERLSFKINDSGCKMLLTSSKLSNDLIKFAEMNTLSISLDGAWEKISEAQKSNPVNINKATDLAYMIYTSGSTGNPKGTMIEHKSLVNRLLWMQKQYNFNEKDNILQKTPYSFDVSVWELILPYLSGSTLIFAKPDGHKNPEYLAKLINKEKITKLHFVPSMLNAFIDYLNTTSTDSLLKTITDIICSGETLLAELSANTTKLLPHIKLHNLYGPTEATIDVSHHEYDANKNTTISVPIGKAIQNYKLYILDECLHPVPIGVVGELYIGGDGLARGYFKRKSLTEDKFINNPFVPKTKIYKTADLCQWLPDGSIEYIGRNDFQIKINGLRIELGEIEAKFAENPKINQCIVTAYNQPLTNSKILVTYYTLKQIKNNKFKTINDKIFEENLKKELSKKLPNYMVPTLFIKLKSMPLNTSGKINRNALPNPVFESAEKIYIPPKTSIEKQLSKIWQDLLGIKKISTDSDFFKLGGNSILSIRLISKINKLFKKNISGTEIFKNPTITTFATNILECGKKKNNFSLLPLIKKDYEDIKKKIDRLNLNSSFTYTKVKNILLTGVTGFLGIYILEELLNKTNSNIYCLIRKSKKQTIKNKFLNSLKYYKKEFLYDSSRVILIEGDLSKKKLGITEKTYAMLSNEIDAIYHNGAHVNHLYNYKTLFEENVSSTLEIIKMAENKKTKEIIYVSTFGISTFANLDTITEDNISNSTGYEHTKYLSEQILFYAQKSGFPIKIFRPGNITGDIETGISNYSNNHSLLFLKGCIQMKAAPKINIPIEMFPVNIISKAIVNISCSKNKNTTFNLRNTNTISWIEYIAEIKKYGYTVKLINQELWAEKHLSKITNDNALFPFKEYYIKLFKNYKEENRETKPKENSAEEITGDNIQYSSLIKTYIEYLQKIGFIPKQK
jgi:amino acid adenylation domain-containing protein/thioester reductase-like protein